MEPSYLELARGCPDRTVHKALQYMAIHIHTEPDHPSSATIRNISFDGLRKEHYSCMSLQHCCIGCALGCQAVGKLDMALDARRLAHASRQRPSRPTQN